MTGLREAYVELREQSLVPAAENLERALRELMTAFDRIDSISVRAKDVSSFLSKSKKLEGGKLKYTSPLEDIQDLIGARVVVYYLSDVTSVVECLSQFFNKIEVSEKEPDRTSEFGYVGWHSIMFLPEDLMVSGDLLGRPKFFELQVKTLFQHAWAQAAHDLSYKRGSRDLSRQAERLIYFAASQSWGADNAFESALELIVSQTRESK